MGKDAEHMSGVAIGDGTFVVSALAVRVGFTAPAPNNVSVDINNAVAITR